MFSKTKSRIRCRATLGVPGTYGADPHGSPGTGIHARGPLTQGLAFPVWLVGPGCRRGGRVGGCCCPGADKGSWGVQPGPQDAPWPGGSGPLHPCAAFFVLPKQVSCTNGRGVVVVDPAFPGSLALP